MVKVPRADFLQWALGVGIGFDPNYPEYLSLLSSGNHARFWVLPPNPSTWPHFAAWLLAGLDEWNSGYLWPRFGSWPNPERSRSHRENVRNSLLLGAGIPAGWAGAVRFGHDEEDTLVEVLYAYLAFQWCGEDDLFFVPDHGRQLLQTDHHDVIHVQCASEERIQRLVAHMAEAGYELPSEPPDGTFKWPAWMGNPEPGTTDAEVGQ